jgi:hypothetical protein
MGVNLMGTVSPLHENALFILDKQRCIGATLLA